MASAKEMRIRIRSVKSITQITRAQETVSVSKAKKAIQAVSATRPYAEKAWKVLVHLARQPGGHNIHPLLTERSKIRRTLVVMISGDRGLAGAYNVNVVRNTLLSFRNSENPVSYIVVGRKGRDMLVRRKKDVIAEFSNLPPAPSFIDVSPIGRLVVDEFLNESYDQVYLSYTEFTSMTRQTPIIRRLLPLDIEYSDERIVSYDVEHHHSSAVFIYEPDQNEILNEIVPRFTALQVYQAIFSSLASEHAARMVAMHNATENGNELLQILQIAYNKMRQQTITNDILDIASGAEALAHSADSQHRNQQQPTLVVVK